MKIYILIAVLSIIIFSSCKDWLDIRPEGQSTEKQMFETGEGYRNVLNGIYKSMGDFTLYGGELGYGIVDCISQQYDLKLIKSSMLFETVQKYVEAGKFNYTDVTLAPTIENIWKAGFNVIANANCLIQNTITASPDLFYKGETERRLILGEAYACRALMHFDLLRLFAPALVNDDERIYVPYVETYPEITGNGIGVKSFLEKVIADLERARSLVIEYDTTAIGKSYNATGKSRFQNTLENSVPGYGDKTVEGFFKGRGYRLSYYAITALLARVYQYADRHDEAFTEAERVMAFEVKGSRNYSFYSGDDFSGILKKTDFNAKTDVKVTSNLIFAVYNEKIYDNGIFRNFFSQKSFVGSVLWLIVNRETQKIFSTSDGLIDEFKTDYRGSEMVFFGNGDTKYPVSGKWFLSDDEGIRKGNITIMPIIRSTEMRYIMAECYARKSNFAEAQKILDQIRKNRGCKESISVTNWKSFINELVCDARREWISEGQLFYLYKRLNTDVNFGNNVIRPLKRSEYLLPVPSNQNL